MAKFLFNALSGNFDVVSNLAEEIGYDATGDTFVTATNVQGALGELDAAIAALPSPIYYAGTWDASTNTPTLANTDSGVEGALYQVNGAGSVDFGAGAISFEVGDKVVNNGTIWQKWDMTDSVTSVNGQTGIVVLDTDDVSDSGATNKYFTAAAAQAAITGGASTITTANLTADRALASNGSGKVAVSSVTATELGYVSGVTSGIQAQLDSKTSAPTVLAVSSDVTLTANRVHLVDTSAARSLTLPAATANLSLHVKDATGNAETNPITLVGTVDGVVNPTISSNYGSLFLIANGSSYFSI